MDKQSHINTRLKVFIYSTQLELSHIISDNLSVKGSMCVVFEDLDNLCSLIRNMNKGPDLLILDYLSFNHEIFNIYAYLRGIKKIFPVIFFNDPCLTRSTMSAHWKAILELTLPEHFDKNNTELSNIFAALETLIESDIFSPYVPLLQKPERIPLYMIKDKYTIEYLKDNSDDCITTFRERNNLPYNFYYLLNLFQKNKHRALRLSDIIELYKNDGKKITESSLKVNISKLKTIIRTDKECCFTINQDNSTYRFMRYK